MLAFVTTTLCTLCPQPQLCLNDPKTKTVIGASGLTSAAPLACPQTHHQLRTSHLFSRCLPCNYDWENLCPARNPSKLSKWWTSCAWSERHWLTWGPLTPVSMPMASNSKCSPTSSMHMKKRTLHQTGQNLCQSSLSCMWQTHCTKMQQCQSNCSVPLQTASSLVISFCFNQGSMCVPEAMTTTPSTFKMSLCHPQQDL